MLWRKLCSGELQSFKETWNVQSRGCCLSFFVSSTCTSNYKSFLPQSNLLLRMVDFLRQICLNHYATDSQLIFTEIIAKVIQFVRKNKKTAKNIVWFARSVEKFYLPPRCSCSLLWCRKKPPADTGCNYLLCMQVQSSKMQQHFSPGTPGCARADIWIDLKRQKMLRCTRLAARWRVTQLHSFDTHLHF